MFELYHSVFSWYVRNAFRFRKSLQDWNRLVAYEEYAEYFHNRAICHSNLGNTERAEKGRQTARRLKREDQ